MIRINLLPPEYATRQTQKELQFLVFGTVGIALLILMSWLTLKKTQAANLEGDIRKAEDDLGRYQAIVDQIASIEESKRRLSAKRDVIVNLNKSRIFFPVFFEDFLPLVPADVWVSDIRLDSQSGLSANYHMSSKALSNYALATWLTSLQQCPHFSNVKIDRIAYEAPQEKGTPSVLSFNLSFTYQHQGPMPLSEVN